MKNEVSTMQIVRKTIVALLIFSLFIISATAVFFPKKSAEITSKLGMEKLSISFEKASYEKTEDINSLAKIVNYYSLNSDTENLSKYGMEMLMHKDYNDYVNFMNSHISSRVGYEILLESQLVDALYKEGNLEEAKAVISSRITTGYQTMGIGTYLCKSVVENSDIKFAMELNEIFDKAYEGSSDLKKYNLTLEGMAITKNLLPTNYDIWTSRLSTLDNLYSK